MVTPLDETATAVAEQAGITNTNEDNSSNTRLSPRLGDEPVADAPTSVIPATVITVKLTQFTNPIYAYEATIRTDIPGGVECVSKFGSTPEEAVERLSKCAGEMLANGVRILWSDGTESIIDDGVIFDVINDRRLLNAYFKQIHDAVAPPPLLDNVEATELTEALFRDVTMLVNECAAKVAARQA
jgi:hypothetical protein